MALRAALEGGQRPSPAAYVATFAFAGVAWTVAGALWSRGQHAFAVSAFLAGVSLGPCLAGYVGAPRAHKPLQRRLVLLAGGLSVLAPSLLAAASLDLGACLALLFAGIMGAAVGHMLAAGGLALALRDQRAFCRCGCPGGATLRRTSGPALLRVRPRADACDGCGSCTRACPLEIDVATLARSGRSAATGDCAGRARRYGS